MPRMTYMPRNLAELAQGQPMPGRQANKVKSRQPPIGGSGPFIPGGPMPNARTMPDNTGPEDQPAPPTTTRQPMRRPLPSPGGQGPMPMPDATPIPGAYTMGNPNLTRPDRPHQFDPQGQPYLTGTPVPGRDYDPRGMPEPTWPGIIGDMADDWWMDIFRRRGR